MPARKPRRPAGDEPTPAPLPPEAALERYDSMRDFSRTPEPAGEAPPERANDAPLTFVIQKHRATRLHYDLRLEIDGVMRSWPIPRGPSTDPAEKRLAVMTEDHPLSYATFEGLIPKGAYGAGEVIVWDRGTYSPDEDGPLDFTDRAEGSRRMREMIANGKVAVTLRGHRMKGSWALVKTAQAPDSWLAFKHRDEWATGIDLAEHYQDSVLTGITIADLQAGRQPPPVDPPPLGADELRGAKRVPFLASVEPMAAEQTREPFSHDDWVFEPKLDGIRATAHIEGGRVRLVTRRGNDITAQYPALAAAMLRQPLGTAVLDGEIVATDEQGVPSFERLQQRMNLTNAVEIRQADRDVPVVYYAFDLLYLDGVDVRRAPLSARRPLLERTLAPAGLVRLVDQFDGDGVSAYHAAVSLGLEGLVAKHRESTYTSGARSARWLKVKHRLTDEFVVVGYTKGLNSRGSTFGGLLLATRGEDGVLVPAGRVGSGFDEVMLKRLRARLEPLRVTTAPLVLPPDLTKDTTFVRPELVVEVEYSQITAEGYLRAPVFLRVRDDKPAEAVRRAPLVAAPAASAAAARTSRSAAAPAAPTPVATSSTDEADAVIEQVRALKKEGEVHIGDASIHVSNLDKVMWPATADEPPATKRDLIEYYARMSPYLLRQVRDRPLTMTRYPNGIEGKFFYQKHVDDPPPYVRTVMVHSETERGDQQYLLVNNVATLVWLAQMADIALHTSLARVNPEPDGHHLSREFHGSKAQVERSLLNYPDFVLFDLDPYIYRGDEAKGEEPELNKKAFEATSKVALWLKELLDGAALSSFVKTSGATGLHIYVPVKRQYDYETIRGVAHTLGGFLVRQHPREVTMEWASEKRRGMVFFDANQNARIKNLACAYSPRAKPGAPVSMPLRWDDLGKVYPTEFTIRTAYEHVQKRGDLWEHILDAKHDLAALVGSP